MKQIDSINFKIKKLQKELTAFEYILQGTINVKYLKCGKKQCICHKEPEKKHGPYYILTKKVKGKTVTKMFSKEKANFLNVYLKKYNDVIRIIRKISEYSDQATNILLKNIK